MENIINVESVNALCVQCGTTNRIDLGQATTKTSICGKCGEKLTSPSQQAVESELAADNPSTSIWLSFAWASAALIALRYGMDHISDPMYRKYIFILLIGMVIFSKTIRTVVVKAAFVLLLISAILFFWINKNALIEHRITASEGVAQIWRIFSGYGPVKNFEKQIRVSKYKNYVEAIDVRDENINTIASKLTSECLNSDLGCQAQKIARFVSTEINYRSDPISGGEYIKKPMQTLNAGAGDCEDKTILLSSLLGSIGIPTVLVFEKGHIYPRACFEMPISSQYLDSNRIFRMGKKHCYDLESTAKWTGLGVSKDDTSKIEAIVDVKTKQLL